MPSEVSAPPLTISPAGVWIVQALLNVEMLPAALVLRPWVSGEGTPAPTDPGMQTLREAGVVTAERDVHPAVADWFETLSAPDVMLSCLGVAGDVNMRAVLARRDGRHVAVSRVDEEVIFQDAGAVRGMGDVARLVLDWMGGAAALTPAKFDPIAVPTVPLTKALGDVIHRNRGAAAILGRLGLNSAQQKIVMAAADRPVRSLGLAISQYSLKGEFVSPAAVSVIETSAGLVVNGPKMGSDKRWWTRIEPGTLDSLTRALGELVKSLPTPHWRNHSRQQ
ncbi:ESX secretion-associated protein EspG [Mycobacteroides chelonae]|jgi:hypothetical protein|uniref:ESX secretion-associated protein EspG n=1 Tax=Mycobacteroides chelonae TaxID=1774 RepID=UPI000993893C|nr:ESX secretion-associated protein EspG [Mycobacteroides chelonae]